MKEGRVDSGGRGSWRPSAKVGLLLGYPVRLIGWVAVSFSVMGRARFTSRVVRTLGNCNYMNSAGDMVLARYTIVASATERPGLRGYGGYAPWMKIYLYS